MYLRLTPREVRAYVSRVKINDLAHLASLSLAAPISAILHSSAFSV